MSREGRDVASNCGCGGASTPGGGAQRGALGDIAEELRGFRAARAAWMRSLVQHLPVSAVSSAGGARQAPPPIRRADIAARRLESATPWDRPFFAGSIASEDLARAVAEAAGDGSSFLCGGGLPNEYEGVPYSNEMLDDGQLKSLGDATSFEQGYLWVVVGTALAFTMYIISDEPRAATAGDVQPQYAGYAVVTRVAGRGSGTFDHTAANGIQWLWELDFRRAVPLGRFVVHVWTETTSLIGAGSAEATCYGTLMAELDGYSVQFLYVPLSYVVYDKEGQQIAHLNVRDCTWDLCQEVAVTATCQGRANGFKIAATHALRTLAVSQGVRQLETDGGHAGAYLGPECAQLRHALYLISACRPLLLGVSEWYFKECAAIDWTPDIDDADDIQPSEDE